MDLEHGGPAQIGTLEATQDLVSLFEGKDLDIGADRNLRRERKELFGVAPRDIRHAANRSLMIEELVGEFGDRTHVHGVDGERASLAKAAQRVVNDLTGGGEDDARVHRLGGRIAGPARPRCAQLAGVAAMRFAARENIDFATPVARDLNHHVGRRAKTEKPEPPAGANFAQAQTPIPDHARTQQWSRLRVGNSFGEPMRERRRNRAILRVAAFVGVAREARIVAEIFLPGLAAVARPARREESRHAHALADLEPRDLLPYRIHHPDDLMAGNNLIAARREIAPSDVQVRPAHPAATHANPNPLRSDVGRKPLNQSQWIIQPNA